MNDKAVVQGYARIRLHTIIAVTETDFNPCDLHSVTDVVNQRKSKSSNGDEQDDCQKTQPTLSNNRNQDTFQLWRRYTPVALE
jgi:hypothetical protein